jgi:putative flippase GtrA
MKLLKQLFKFGVTGVICFIIDFGVYMLCLKVFGINYLISGFIGFVVSTLVNYWLSTKFVFDVQVKSKAVSAAWFFGLSASALVVHEIVLWFFGTIVLHDMYAIAKVLTTGVVMVYNFVTRKIVLEKPFAK